MALRRRGKNAKLELLGRVSLFSACNRGELARIASLADQVEAKAGSVLTREGEPGSEFFVIAAGNGKAAVKGRKVASLGPGSFFGELALLDQGPRTATVSAESDMELLVLDSRSFSALIEETPTVARKIFRELARRLRAAERAATH
jgi:CRP/FNR family transcriptional regulator, cyclic AMP receptor protein